MLVTSDGNPILDENNNPIIINGQAKGYSITENGSRWLKWTDGEQANHQSWRDPCEQTTIFSE